MGDRGCYPEMEVQNTCPIKMDQEDTFRRATSNEFYDWITAEALKRYGEWKGYENEQ